MIRARTGPGRTKCVRGLPKTAATAGILYLKDEPRMVLSLRQLLLLYDTCTDRTERQSTCGVFQQQPLPFSIENYKKCERRYPAPTTTTTAVRYIYIRARNRTDKGQKRVRSFSIATTAGFHVFIQAVATQYIEELCTVYFVPRVGGMPKTWGTDA